MSRSNHYRICEGHSHNRVFQGECPYHNGWFYAPVRYGEAREILGRRTWRRKTRYPYGIKRNMDGPPSWWWRAEHKHARAVYRQMMFRSEDPALPRERDLIDLWGWY